MQTDVRDSSCLFAWLLFNSLKTCRHAQKLLKVEKDIFNAAKIKEEHGSEIILKAKRIFFSFFFGKDKHIRKRFHSFPSFKAPSREKSP